MENHYAKSFYPGGPGAGPGAGPDTCCDQANETLYVKGEYNLKNGVIEDNIYEGKLNVSAGEQVCFPQKGVYSQAFYDELEGMDSKSGKPTDFEREHKTGQAGIPDYQFSSDPDVSAIEAKLFTKASQLSKPAILVIGRGAKGEVDCRFETDALSKFTILKLDINESAMPDIVADFDCHDERIRVANKLAEMKANLVLVQFDISVFKFMDDLPSLFSDVCNMLTDGGMFIFPYEVAGGCICFPVDISASPNISMLNRIFIPLSYLSARDVNLEDIKNDIISSSMHMVLGRVGMLFDAGMYTDKGYPFFNYPKCTYYVCTKTKMKR
jgi:hypothetical protein